MNSMERRWALFRSGVEYGYRQANSDRGLLQTLDEADKYFKKIQADSAEPVEYPSSPQDTPESERMYVCLKCGAESWRVPSAKLARCENGECSGQIIANPRRG